MCMGWFEKVVWKACPLFRRPFQLKVLDRYEVKTFGYPPNCTAMIPKPIRCWKSRPNPKGRLKRSLNWFITNSTISAHRLPHTMPKAKPYGRRNTKHGAESVTKSFSRPQSPRSVQYHDEKNRLHYNRFVITTKRTLDEIERTGDLTTRDLLRKSWSNW